MDSNPNVRSKQNKKLNLLKMDRLESRRKRLKISKESQLFVVYANSHTPPYITFCCVNAKKIKTLKYAKTVLFSIEDKNINEFIFKAVHFLI
jgi:hypothetical protein